MKNWSCSAAIVVLCLALVIGVACGGGEEEEGGVKQLKMGVGLPLSGIYGAIVGAPAKDAFDLAADDIGTFTVGGEQYRWKMIYEDNGPTVDKGTASTMKFIYENNVDFMHQSGASPGLAAESLCGEIGLILDIAGANPEHFSPDKPHLFQIAATWGLQFPPFFDWLSKEHPEVKRLAYVVPADDTGYALEDAFRAGADYYGLEVVAGEIVPPETTEYYPIATRVMAEDPELFISTGATVSEILWDMGYEGLSATWFWLPESADQVGWDKCEGFLIAMPHPFGGLWPEAEAIAVDYEAHYGVDLNPAAFWAINVMYVITDTLKQAGTVDDRDKIIQTMETGTFDSLVGSLKYGGEVLNGIGHMAIWPSPVYEVVGEREYRAIAVYSVEETEAIVAEVYAGR